MDFCISSATITRPNEDADAMEGLEIAILARLDVPDPYLLRDQA